MSLYHYTCSDGFAAIGAGGRLLPAGHLTTKQVPWTGQFVWLTDLAEPMRDALGLTSHIIDCDRTEHRYRVTDESLAVKWTAFARHLPRSVRDQIERTPGAMPAHWWISTEPVPVELDPIKTAAVA